MSFEKRPTGNSGIEVAPLALGTNVFGWTADEKTSFAILDAFVDGGGSMIDTADVYSSWVAGHRGGESETIIGRWLKRDPAKRDKVLIATKVGFLGAEVVDDEFVAALRPDQIRSGCEASLRRLGVETIDLYYQHKDNPGVPLPDSLGAMDELAKAGKIRAIGLSQFTASRLQDAMDAAATNGLLKPACLQTWYNMVERDKLEGDLRGTALRNGLGIFPFYGLANGFLTGKYRNEADLSKSVRGERVRGYLEGKRRCVLDALDEVAAESGAAVATVALAWTIAQPGIVAALASATSVEQLTELMAAMTLKLTPAQLDRLSAASSSVER